MNRRADAAEHAHREAEGNVQTLTNHLAELSSRYTATDTRVRQAEDKIKTEEQTVRDLVARVSLLPTAEDLASVRRDLNEKVCFTYFLLLALYFIIIIFVFALLMYLCYIFIYVTDSCRFTKRFAATR